MRLSALSIDASEIIKALDSVETSATIRNIINFHRQKLTDFQQLDSGPKVLVNVLVVNETLLVTQSFAVALAVAKQSAAVAG